MARYQKLVQKPRHHFALAKHTDRISNKFCVFIFLTPKASFVIYAKECPVVVMLKLGPKIDLSMQSESLNTYARDHSTHNYVAKAVWPPLGSTAEDISKR